MVGGGAVWMYLLHQEIGQELINMGYNNRWVQSPSLPFPQHETNNVSLLVNNIDWLLDRSGGYDCVSVYWACRGSG